MDIRKATIDDLVSVYYLAKELATSFEVEYEAFQTSFLKNFESDDAIILISETYSRINGYLLGFSHHAFFVNGKISWVEEIYVDEEYRNRGVGKLLMTEFEKWSREKNCKMVALATRRAAEFYKAIGFEESAAYYVKKL